jgi:predicted DNA-binding antitoxin AbrB/MazE fold protein
VKTIHAIYENGVFRPTEPVDLPERSEVTVEPKPADQPATLSPHQERIYALLSQALDTDDPGFSERHNKHQP